MKTPVNENFQSIEKLISVNAYHFEFDESGRTTDLFLNLSLTQASFGNGKNDPLSFTARLKEVEIEMILSPTSLLNVHPKTTPPKFMETYEVQETHRESYGVTDSHTLGGKPILAQISKKTNDVLQSGIQTNRVIDALRIVAIQPSKLRRYLTITPNFTEFFDGESLSERHEFVLATIKDNRNQSDINKDVKQQTQPIVKVEVRFLRRNLSIEIKKIHNDHEMRVLAARMDKKGSSDKRTAAAECFLRDLLIEQGLAQSETWRDGTLITLAQKDAEAI